MKTFTPATSSPQRSATYLMVSALLHLAIFGGVALLINTKPEYGVQLGESDVEVNLVAGPTPPMSKDAESNPPPVTGPAPEPAHEVLVSAPTKPEDMVVPDTKEPEIEASKPAEVSSSLPPVTSNVSSKVKPLPSSPKEASPASLAGAKSQVKPAYLRNPPPEYPPDLRRRGIEGEVILEVTVSPQGKCAAVKVKSSSGYSELDSCALKAVRHWLFKPATSAGMPVEDTVEIPVTFTLQN